jgi:hypothetical protein
MLTVKSSSPPLDDSLDDNLSPGLFAVLAAKLKLVLLLLLPSLLSPIMLLRFFELELFGDMLLSILAVLLSLLLLSMFIALLVSYCSSSSSRAPNCQISNCNLRVLGLHASDFLVMHAFAAS